MMGERVEHVGRFNLRRCDDQCAVAAVFAVTGLPGQPGHGEGVGEVMVERPAQVQLDLIVTAWITKGGNVNSGQRKFAFGLPDGIWWVSAYRVYGMHGPQPRRGVCRCDGHGSTDLLLLKSGIGPERDQVLHRQLRWGYPQGAEPGRCRVPTG